MAYDAAAGKHRLLPHAQPGKGAAFRHALAATQATAQGIGCQKGEYQQNADRQFHIFTPENASRHA